MRFTFFPQASCALALLLSPLVTAGQNRPDSAAPKIGDFVLYAERSIRIGNHSHTEHGDVGVRTTMSPSAQGRAQLRLEDHAKCGTAFSPSTSLETDSETGAVWTNSLQRPKDSEIGKQGSFPATLMPPLPLARASGKGEDIRVKEHDSQLLTPGTYGDVVIEEHGTLRLSAGSYTFASVRMEEEAALLGERAKTDDHPSDSRVPPAAGLDVHIVGFLDMG